ncbi:uncharacterized protein N0V89_010174 [Didymosphaeria variabile]|uniref:Zincin n=1 Tax=Didymosphaeria variabile TaxID=1932322 RepID=A0A9W8XEQ3_9PLEO|nr:uncharacterized protein N0V89_010174 [Didymosphaeria variabile]KAJ4348796.1 hypothetical protein N0V89_010174 [Didymosphaeria variabile]
MKTSMSSGKDNTETLTEPSSQSDTLDKFITILNREDRFNLLNDPTVQEGNLDNEIHPIFHHAHFLGQTPHIKQALQLASLYLTTPSLLIFYLPLTFGIFHKDNDGKLYRTYTKSSDVSRAHELEIIQAAMTCLSHSLQWEWKTFHEDRKWGSTQHFKNVPTVHTDACPVYDDGEEKTFFMPNTGTHIALDKGMLEFYKDEESGYVTRSRCEQFRHDFQLANVLGHEIAHAYGAMSHGNLREPWLGRDHPRNEQGYAWENYMFGSLVDPTKKVATGNYVHLHKVWQSREVTRKYWGCEWTAVPVAWTALWFRKETWEEVEEYGHRAVALPEPTLKLYLSLGLDRFVVFTDDEEAREDLEWGRDSAGLSYLFSKGGVDAIPSKAVSRAMWMPLSELAKEPLVPTPQRRFDEALVSERQYLRNAQDRDHAIYMAMRAVNNNLTKPDVISIAAGVKASRRGAGRLRPVRPSKKCSVAAGPMTSSSSEASPNKFAEGFSDIPPEEFLSEKYIGYRPEFYNTRPSRQPLLAASPSVHNRGKRLRDSDNPDSLPRSKKLRRDC